MATRGRGGKRTPRNPAPVSGPGAMSRRTDGGPGQPVRPIPAEQHGDRKENVELQQAAPMAAGSPPGAAVPATGPGAAAAGGFSPIDVFAPTDRPGEPITAGAEPLPPRLRVDPTLALAQAMYERFPNEDLARLIADLQSRGRPGGRR